jgi:hypothetical protein
MSRNAPNKTSSKKAEKDAERRPKLQEHSAPIEVPGRSALPPGGGRAAAAQQEPVMRVASWPSSPDKDLTISGPARMDKDLAKYDIHSTDRTGVNRDLGIDHHRGSPPAALPVASSAPSQQQRPRAGSFDLDQQQPPPAPGTFRESPPRKKKERRGQKIVNLLWPQPVVHDFLRTSI